MNKNIVIAFLVGAVLVGAGFMFFGGAAHFGALPTPNSNNTPNQAQISAKIGTLNAFTLGTYAVATGTAVFQEPFPRGLTYGFQQGDTCLVQLSSATSTLGFSEDAQLTSVSTSTATATVSFFNAASTTVNIATGTLTLICNHFGY